MRSRDKSEDEGEDKGYATVHKCLLTEAGGGAVIICPENHARQCYV
jgi:hypothetical protein